MMMKVAGEPRERGWKTERWRNERQEKLKEQEQEEDHSDHPEPAVCRCGLSRVANVLSGVAAHARVYNAPWFIFAPHFALWGPYTFGSDTSLVYTCPVRLYVSSSVPLLPSLLLVPLPSSSDRAFAATTCTRPYRHFRHPRDSTKVQLDGSNWTANDRTVIRTSNPSFTHSLSLSHPISPFTAEILFSRYVAWHLLSKTLPLSCWTHKEKLSKSGSLEGRTANPSTPKVFAGFFSRSERRLETWAVEFITRSDTI